ncbi:MAG TPA: hypothetical protein VHC39_05190 [Rhizomicrobium sp.]|nr:hypothetical protein [Rhizomicrobium sp.]
MNEVIRWCQDRSLRPLLVAASIVVLLAIGAAIAWSFGGREYDAHAVSLRLLQHAYDKVVPGKTSEFELAGLGFDQSRFQARVLSGLGVQEYFMTRTSAEFDRMDPAVKACFDASDRCTALVFPLAGRASGLMAANAAPATQGRVVFLIRSGRVAYKAVQGG